jgi:hypothetical protein
MKKTKSINQISLNLPPATAFYLVSFFRHLPWVPIPRRCYQPLRHKARDFYIGNHQSVSATAYEVMS